MGLVGSLVWANSYSKKQCRSLFCRMRAAVKKVAKAGGSKQQFKFRYDPVSYVLNFDDGCNGLGEEATKFHTAKPQGFPEATVWVYVLRVEAH